MSEVTIRRALLSVSDKTGLAELGKALAERGVELVSTGGTAKARGVLAALRAGVIDVVVLDAELATEVLRRAQS